jgi:hypothetical protein
MLNALCAVALAATCSLDSHLARVEASTGASAALAVAASPTSFEAHNFGLVPQVLQFRCGAATQIRVLGPGASLRYAFPRQQLAGVVLEVHALEAGRFASRASIDLQRLSRGGAEGAWILEGSNDAWLQYGDALHANDASVGEPKHVPVPPPQPRPVEQRPVRPTTRPRPF